MKVSASGYKYFIQQVNEIRWMNLFNLCAMLCLQFILRLTIVFLEYR